MIFLIKINICIVIGNCGIQQHLFINNVDDSDIVTSPLQSNRSSNNNSNGTDTKSSPKTIVNNSNKSTNKDLASNSKKKNIDEEGHPLTSDDTIDNQKSDIAIDEAIV